MAETYTVNWSIDIEADSPKDAAQQVWDTYFNHGEDGAATHNFFVVDEQIANNVQRHTEVDLTHIDD